MTDGCLLTDDVTFEAVISVPCHAAVCIPPPDHHPCRNWTRSKLQGAHHGIRGVPLTRVERERFLSQSAGLAVPDLLVLLAVTDVLVVSLPVSERQGLAPCFQPLETNLMEKSPRFRDVSRDQTHLESSTNLLHMWKK